MESCSKDMEIFFPKEDAQIANKHMEAPQYLEGTKNKLQ